jgi:hypothetical protein
MASFNCLRCESEFTADALPRRGQICFKCHVKTINLGFTYGKEDFHGDTIKQRQDLQEAQAKAAGIKAEPVGNRWV